MEFKRPTTVFQTHRSGFVPLDSAFSLLRYPELTTPDKLRMGFCLAYLKITKNWKSLERYTAESWCERFMGVEGYRAIWKPLLVGKFGEHAASEINMAWLWARLHCRTSELGTFRGGFDQFTQCAEKYLVKAGVRVFKDVSSLSVERLKSGWSVAAASHGVQEHEAVVVAASPRAFSKLVGVHAPEHSNRILSQPALGVQVVILALNSPLGTHYWYSLQRDSRQPFLAAIEHTNFSEPSEYDGEHLVYLAKYVDTRSEEWQQSDDHLTELARLTCRMINPQFSDDNVIRTRIFRSEYAQPVVGLNASRFVPSIHVNGVPRLFHASMGHVYPWDRGTNFALELGETVAEEVLKSLAIKR
jgi:protoporphyrinogen oxidase